MVPAIEFGENSSRFSRMDHLKYSGISDREQITALETILRGSPLLMQVLEGLSVLELPEGMLVAGAIYNSVWNHLTGRPALHGIKDIDVFYFDDSDLSYSAEDAVIARVSKFFSHLPLPVETRNQARVHKWFPDKFDQPFAPLSSAKDMLSRYASKTHAVAANLDAHGNMQIYAPFGLDDIFSFRVTPNHVLDNQPAHTEKGARAKRNWPEIEVMPW